MNAQQDTLAMQYRLYKLAIYLAEQREYKIPEGMVPDRLLCDRHDFFRAAFDFATEYYSEEIPAAIAENAEGGLALAKDMLRHLAEYKSGNKGGNFVSKTATALLATLPEPA